jgi:hypothetical protein
MSRKGVVAVGGIGVLAAATALAVLAGAVRAGAAPACVGRDLTGSFAAVPGSAGAGQISYNLRLRNRSSRACFVSGLPALHLVDRAGRLLPTHITPAHPGALTAVRVVLRPGGYSAATARFSPDVPGTGEQMTGPCERKAFRARVTAPPGGGVVVVPLVPATPVCERGSIAFSVLVSGKNGPATA